MAGLWRFLPCGSCCECTLDCSAEGCADGIANCEYQVTISGIVNSSSTECAVFNDTFVLGLNPSPINSDCEFIYEGSSYSCLSNTLATAVYLWFASGAGVNHIWVQVYSSLWSAFYHATYTDPTKTPCTSLSATNIPWTSDTFIIGPCCDGSSSTCTVTSL